MRPLLADAAPAGGRVRLAVVLCLPRSACSPFPWPRSACCSSPPTAPGRAGDGPRAVSRARGVDVRRRQGGGRA